MQNQLEIEGVAVTFHCEEAVAAELQSDFKRQLLVINGLKVAAFFLREEVLYLHHVLPPACTIVVEGDTLRVNDKARVVPKDTLINWYPATTLLEVI